MADIELSENKQLVNLIEKMCLAKDTQKNWTSTDELVLDTLIRYVRYDVIGIEAVADRLTDVWNNIIENKTATTPEIKCAELLEEIITELADLLDVIANTLEENVGDLLEEYVELGE